MTDWSIILMEHGPAVWRTVYRLLDHHADALDCYQETFLAAWRFAQRETVGDWRSFLVNLATRRAMDRLRQRYRNRVRIIAIDRLSESASDAECPVGQASAKELMNRVREGLAELPDKQAQVFWLSCVEGLSHQQISDRLGITTGEVRVLLHRARTRLGAFLGCKNEGTGDDHEG